MNTQALVVTTREEHFEGDTIRVAEHEGQEWYLSEDIGRALGFADPQKGINNLFNRNRDDFGGISVTLTVRATDGKQYQTRVFNSMGVIHLCTIAGTPQAKGMSLWVAKAMAGVTKRALAALKDAKIATLEADNARLRVMADYGRRISALEGIGSGKQKKGTTDDPYSGPAWLTESMVTCECGRRYVGEVLRWKEEAYSASMEVLRLKNQLTDTRNRLFEARSRSKGRR